MKFAVVGPGSVGSLITYSLNQSGIKPFIVFRTPQKARLAREKGFKLQFPYQTTLGLKGYFASYDNIPEKAIDIAFICTKSYDVPSAVNSLKPKLKEGATVISTQNGLGAFETIKVMLPNSEALALVLNCGAFRKSDYEFMFSGCGESYIGREREGISDSIELVINSLTSLSVKLVNNITPFRWIKLAVNAAVNPLTAVRRVRNGAILTDKYLRSLAFSIAREVKIVAESMKIRIVEDPLEELVKVVNATKDNYSSMLQDLLMCRRTEIDFINGAVVGRALAIGISASLNKALWLLVKSIESANLKPSSNY